MRYTRNPCSGFTADELTKGAVDAPTLSGCFSSRRSRPGRNFVTGRSLMDKTPPAAEKTRTQILRSAGRRWRPVADRRQVGRPGRVHGQDLARGPEGGD